jgi:phosphatidylserine/phosphatidylglycerophosphate/cardiolipin synthase-like enzyme
VTGSANMDDMSFFYSSELTIAVFNASLALETRLRLASEHLGREVGPSFDAMFEEFHRVANANLEAFSQDRDLVGRPVFMAPKG